MTSIGRASNFTNVLIRNGINNRFGTENYLSFSECLEVVYLVYVFKLTKIQFISHIFL